MSDKYSAVKSTAFRLRYSGGKAENAMKRKDSSEEQVPQIWFSLSNLTPVLFCHSKYKKVVAML